MVDSCAEDYKRHDGEVEGGLRPVGTQLIGERVPQAYHKPYLAPGTVLADHLFVLVYQAPDTDVCIGILQYMAGPPT